MTKKIKDLTLEECRNFCKKYLDNKNKYECKNCPLAHEKRLCNGYLLAFCHDHIERIKNNEIKIAIEEWENYEEEKEKYIKEYIEEHLLDPNKEVEL